MLDLKLKYRLKQPALEKGNISLYFAGRITAIDVERASCRLLLVGVELYKDNRWNSAREFGEQFYIDGVLLSEIMPCTER